MKPWLVWTLRGLLAALVLIQFYPVDRSNPPVTAEIQAPAEVMAVLKESCYDCHSNQSDWPWYSYVAPVSFFVSDHVVEGRDELNFSDWGNYSERRRNRKQKETWEEVEEGKMPLPSYLWIHTEAELSDEDLAILKEWANSAPPTSDAPPEIRTEENNPD